MEKNIKNANTVICKLELTLIRATNYRLKIGKEVWQKKEEMVEKQKIKAIATKQQRAKEEISLSNKEKGNYKSNIRNKTDLDQADDEYSLSN